MDNTFDDIAHSIDHVLLHPSLTDEELIKGCAFAVECNCASACVKPGFAAFAVKLMRGTGIAVGTTVGFPHGSAIAAVKRFEAERAIEAGVDEIAMAIDTGKARSGEWGEIRDGIAAVAEAAAAGGALLKVIFEIDFLPDFRIEELCRVCNEVKPAFLVTSTGFGFSRVDSGDYNYRGATVEHLALMRRTALPEIAVEASGGLRTLDDLLTARRAGAVRIATTATREILDEAARRLTAELEKRAEMEESDEKY